MVQTRGDKALEKTNDGLIVVVVPQAVISGYSNNECLFPF